jgi:hypothetical protein
MDATPLILSDGALRMLKLKVVVNVGVSALSAIIIGIVELRKIKIWIGDRYEVTILAAGKMKDASYGVTRLFAKCGRRSTADSAIR